MSNYCNHHNEDKGVSFHHYHITTSIGPETCLEPLAFYHYSHHWHHEHRVTCTGQGKGGEWGDKHPAPDLLLWAFACR